jgi:rhodanese-related sulfurtransferase
MRPPPSDGDAYFDRGCRIDIEVAKVLRREHALRGHTCAVTTALPRISRESLREKIENRDEFVLVDALSPMSFAFSHLPGAINLTPGWVDDRARRRIPDFDTEIVVYCESSDCDSSIRVANRLIDLGYRNIRRYAEGKRDWTEAGLPLDGARVG